MGQQQHANVATTTAGVVVVAGPDTARLGYQNHFESTSASGGQTNPIRGQQQQQQQQEDHVQLSSSSPSAAAVTLEKQQTRQVTPSTPTVHDKSMAQARYLYSTLTSNVTALLAATNSPVSAAAATTTTSSSSGSGNGSGSQTAAPRGPATAASTGGGASTTSGKTTSERPTTTTTTTTSASTSSSSPTIVHGLHRKQAQFVADRHQGAGILTIAHSNLNAPPSSPAVVSPSRLSAVPGAASGQVSPRTLSHALEVKSLGHKAASSSSGGGKQPKRRPDDDDDDSSSSSDSDQDEPAEGAQRRGSSSSSSTSSSVSFNDNLAGAATPSIVESTCADPTRRRSSQTSRSNSTDTQQLQQQQQLQPAMDPEMHALWAQGADLDTGNGNFIMATRRRRSVHAIHQAQLHQQAQALAVKQTPTASDRCYKIEEGRQEQRPAGGSRGSKLRDELRKLRSTSSIEEIRRTGQRTRLVSESQISRKSDPSVGLEEFQRSTTMGETSSDELLSSCRSPTREMDSEAGEFKLEESVVVEVVEEAEEDDDDDEQNEEEQPQLQLQQQPEDPDEAKRTFYLAELNLEYNLDDLESSSSLLANLFQWNFPIFELADHYGQSILSKLSYRIFYDSGFFDCK